VRQRSVAEHVAAQLRFQILSGALVDGQKLPAREKLLAEFEVSPPSLREAMRILETEGLIVVRRGRNGGSIVQSPSDVNAAHSLGMVLQSRRVTLHDTGTALQMLEPLCVSLCASRKDRKRQVLPQLIKANDAARAALDDRRRFTDTSRLFHEAIVATCGNDTLILVVGALESLYSAHLAMWARDNPTATWSRDRSVGQRTVDEHDEIIKFVRDGDGDAAAKLLGRHHADAFTLVMTDLQRTTLIDAAVLEAG
jgi:DNA-binding FadR family transcriptional regulator